MKTTMEETLKKGLRELDLADIEDGLSALLIRYLHELEIFNAAFNLVKAASLEEIVIKHLLDSLAPWKTFEAIIKEKQEKGVPCTIADVGSGAGFPGIPLACLFLLKNPDVEFTLIERMHKRCAVLENVRAVLGLKNITVLPIEVEKAPQKAFDLVVFRAFRPLDKEILLMVQNLLKEKGLLVAYKGRLENITEEMRSLGSLVSQFEIVPVVVPFLDAERYVVLVF